MHSLHIRSFILVLIVSAAGVDDDVDGNVHRAQQEHEATTNEYWEIMGVEVEKVFRFPSWICTQSNEFTTASSADFSEEKERNISYVTIEIP